MSMFTTFNLWKGRGRGRRFDLSAGCVYENYRPFTLGWGGHGVHERCGFMWSPLPLPPPPKKKYRWSKIEQFDL
jgi:hypothetical protein